MSLSCFGLFSAYDDGACEVTVSYDGGWSIETSNCDTANAQIFRTWTLVAAT